MSGPARDGAGPGTGCGGGAHPPTSPGPADAAGARSITSPTVRARLSAAQAARGAGDLRDGDLDITQAGRPGLVQAVGEAFLAVVVQEAEAVHGGAAAAGHGVGPFPVPDWRVRDRWGASCGTLQGAGAVPPAKPDPESGVDARPFGSAVHASHEGGDATCCWRRPAGGGAERAKWRPPHADTADSRGVPCNGRSSIARYAMTSASEPVTVASVDLQRYLGTWYEIARLPMRHEPEDYTDITATYALNPDGTVQVRNRARDGKGQPQESVGEATVVEGSGNAKLEVSFMPDGLKWVPFTKGDYWILRLDPEYRTALVGSPDRKYLWLLAREPALPAPVQQAFLDAARGQGYGLADLIHTPHTGRPVS